MLGTTQIMIYFYHGATAAVGQGLLIIKDSWSHSDTPHLVGRVINPKQRTLLDNTQHSREINIHFPGGIRTQNPSKGVAIDPCLRLRGHWDQQIITVMYIKSPMGLKP